MKAYRFCVYGVRVDMRDYMVRRESGHGPCYTVIDGVSYSGVQLYGGEDGTQYLWDPFAGVDGYGIVTQLEGGDHAYLGLVVDYQLGDPGYVGFSLDAKALAVAQAIILGSLPESMAEGRSIQLWFDDAVL